MAKSAKATIELAAQKSDEWLEANETEVTRLHERESTWAPSFSSLASRALAN